MFSIIYAKKYVRKCISNEKIPSFYLNTLNNLKETLPKENKYSLCRFIEKSKTLFFKKYINYCILFVSKSKI